MGIAVTPSAVAAGLREDRHDLMAEGDSVCLGRGGKTEEDRESCEEANHALKETSGIA